MRKTQEKEGNEVIQMYRSCSSSVSSFQKKRENTTKIEQSSKTNMPSKFMASERYSSRWQRNAS